VAISFDVGQAAEYLCLVAGSEFSAHLRRRAEWTPSSASRAATSPSRASGPQGQSLIPAVPRTARLRQREEAKLKVEADQCEIPSDRLSDEISASMPRESRDSMSCWHDTCRGDPPLYVHAQEEREPNTKILIFSAIDLTMLPMLPIIFFTSMCAVAIVPSPLTSKWAPWQIPRVQSPSFDRITPPSQSTTCIPISAPSRTTRISAQVSSAHRGQLRAHRATTQHGFSADSLVLVGHAVAIAVAITSLRRLASRTGAALRQERLAESA